MPLTRGSVLALGQIAHSVPDVQVPTGTSVNAPPPQVNVRELWLTFSSVTLAFVFVFGNSIRSIYEAVLFLFVVHPYDVGDWLLLANGDMVKVRWWWWYWCCIAPENRGTRIEMGTLPRQRRWFTTFVAGLDPAGGGDCAAVLLLCQGRRAQGVLPQPQAHRGAHRQHQPVGCGRGRGSKGLGQAAAL